MGPSCPSLRPLHGHSEPARKKSFAGLHFFLAILSASDILAGMKQATAMKINAITKQTALELMGSQASDSEAVAMIALLEESGYEDTSEIPDDVWSRMIELAIGEAEISDGLSSAAATLGRRGGSAKSERKTAAVRENGKRGGRPRLGQLKAKLENDIIIDATPGFRVGDTVDTQWGPRHIVEIYRDPLPSYYSSTNATSAERLD